MPKITGISGVCSVLLLSGFSLACPPKQGGEEETDDSSQTDETTMTGQALDGAWAVGRYYQPISTNYATLSKPSFEIFADLTAALEEEYCEAGRVEYPTLGWRAVDEDQVEFFSLKQDEPVMWFSGKAFNVIRMRRTDDPMIMFVSDGSNEEGPTLGEFKSGVGCLIIRDEVMGCYGGAFVSPCAG